jgi:hypothetical protein
MSDTQVPAVPATSSGPALTQVQRVIQTFTSPTKTFLDIKRSTSWWLPFVLSAIFGYALFAAITVKVTWPQVAENNIKMSPKQAEQLDKLPAEQRATNMKISAMVTEGIWGALPIMSLIVMAVMAGVLLATINFGFGGKATFWEVFAVVWFANLPGLIKFLLGTIALFAGLDPDSFNVNNFAGTNVGYYLPPDTSKVIMALATAIDPITIWILALCSIGVSIVAGTKRSAGYIAVFGWWILLVLIGVGAAAAFS